MADTINIITSQLAAGRGPDEWSRRVVERPVGLEAVKAGYQAFMEQMKTLLAVGKEKPGPLGDYQLEELTFTAVIGPDGDFKLVGTNAPDVSGGMRFTLRRKHTIDTADLVRLLVGTEPTDDVKQNLMRNNLTTLPSDPSVSVRVEGVVPVAEQNLPLPVIEVGF